MTYTKMITCGLWLCMAMLLWGCPAAETERKLALEPFFDLEAYVDQEVARLDNDSFQFVKTVEIDGKREAKEFNSLDMEKELAILRKSDINRPAWLDKYEVDSTYDAQGHLQSLQYVAQDKDLRTRSLLIRYTPTQEVERIEIQNRGETLLSSSSTDLVYQAANQFIITTLQNTQATSDTHVNIDLRWEKGK